MPSEFPYLFEVESDRSHPLSGHETLRFGSGAPADIALDEVSGDQLVFQIESKDDAWFFRPLGGDITLSVNQAPAKGRVQLEHLSIIQAGRHVFVFVEHDDPSVSTSFGANQWLVGQLLSASSEQLAETMPAAATMEMDRSRLRADDGSVVPLELPGAIELEERQMLIGRDSGRVDICLTDFRVSRVHARVHRRGRTATIADLRSANGTFVNGHLIDRPEVIREGDRIHIGPYRLVFTGSSLFPLTHDKNVQLVAENLVRRVPDRENRGQLKVILDDVSLVIRPREFLCILGPSGSGKSTLLSALSGRRQADEGCVLLNGEDLYDHFDALKQNLAVVPQKDVLHDVLPLNTALRYTAKMRLPADMSRKDVDARISEMLDSVHLKRHQSTQIRRLSGGQTKRASWVNEAICNPSLIFLDEVTSGLDEQTDSEMMQMFRKIADEGKTIVCVTHSVTYVEQNCDLVAILAAGGVLAFIGPPADAQEYFDIARLGDVYERLGERSPAEWKSRFRESKHHKEYVARRLPEAITEMPEATFETGKTRLRGIAAILRQFSILTRRYLAIELAAKKALAAMLGQSLFIAILLVWLFGNISVLDVQDEARRLAELDLWGTPWGELLEEDKEPYLREAARAMALAGAVLTGRRGDRAGHLGHCQHGRFRSHGGTHLPDSTDRHGRPHRAAAILHSRILPGLHLGLLGVPGAARNVGHRAARSAASCRQSGPRNGMDVTHRLRRAVGPRRCRRGRGHPHPLRQRQSGVIEEWDQSFSPFRSASSFLSHFRISSHVTIRLS